MINRLLALGLAGILSCAAYASGDVDDVQITAIQDSAIMADRDRRDDRKGDRDDKQDCRQEEGRVGDDKRECKQEERGEDDDDEKEGAAA